MSAKDRQLVHVLEDQGRHPRGADVKQAPIEGHMEGSGRTDDILPVFSTTAAPIRNTGLRSRAPAGDRSMTVSRKPDSEEGFLQSGPMHSSGTASLRERLHDELDDHLNHSRLPRPMVSTGTPADGPNSAPNQRLEDIPAPQARLADQVTRGEQVSPPTAKPYAASPVPPDRRGNGTPSSARLPIFDSDSEEDIPAPQSVKASDVVVDPNGHSDSVTEQRSPGQGRPRAQATDKQGPNRAESINSGLATARLVTSAQERSGATYPTPVHSRRDHAEDSVYGHVRPRR